MKKRNKILIPIFIVIAIVAVVALVLFIKKPKEHTHDYIAKVTPPTCTEQGYTAYTCSCGERYVDTYTNIIDHDYIDGVCRMCGAKKFSANLEFALSDDGTYYIVTGIGTCTDTDVIIPSKYNGLPVTCIGEEAFYECTAFTSITIPDSITSIGLSAFWGCCINKVYITDIAAWCRIKFYNTDSNPLGAYYNYSDNISARDKNFYLNGELVTNLVIPHGVTSIGNYAFERTHCLVSVTISDSVTSIGESAFNNCSNLTSATIPDSVISIGACAFENCISLASITIGNNITSIGHYAFDNTVYYNDETNWENGVLYIENHLIKAKYNISGTYEVKDGTRSIADSAFYDCRSLESINIPDGIANIGPSAFYRCTALTSITIPDSVTSIGGSAFYSCSSLKSIYYGGTTEQWNKINKESTWDFRLGNGSYKTYFSDGDISK